MVWYRGHFAAAGSETGITIDGATGGRGVYLVWLNGALLGSEASGPKNFSFPNGVLRKGEDNTIAVLVSNIGHDEDFRPTDGFNSRAAYAAPFCAVRTVRLNGESRACLAGNNLSIESVDR